MPREVPKPRSAIERWARGGCPLTRIPCSASSAALRAASSSVSPTSDSRRALITTGAISCAQVWKVVTSCASNRRGSRVCTTSTPIVTPRTINGAAISEEKRSSPVSGKYL
jgi:hypothetical protein